MRPRHAITTFIASLLVALSGASWTLPASADTIWNVEYYLRTDVAHATHFYGDGAYVLLAGPDYTTVYTHQRDWIFLGFYGQAALPAGFPTIAFPAGTDIAAVVPVSITTEPPPVQVPEPTTLALVAAGLAYLTLVNVRVRNRLAGLLGRFKEERR